MNTELEAWIWMEKQWRETTEYKVLNCSGLCHLIDKLPKWVVVSPLGSSESEIK